MSARHLALTGVVTLMFSGCWAFLDFGTFALSKKAITPDDAATLVMCYAIISAALTIGISAILPKDGEK